MTTWNTAFEEVPAGIDSAVDGPEVIRTLKTAISERGEVEHNFKNGTIPFHKPGKCSVMYMGNTAAIAALTNVSEGCIAFNNAALVIDLYYTKDGTPGWNVVTIPHNKLDGLYLKPPSEWADPPVGEDPGTPEYYDHHTQYVELDGSGQTLVQDLSVAEGITIDGRDLNVDGDVLGKITSTRGLNSDWTTLFKGVTLAPATVYGPTDQPLLIKVVGTNAGYCTGIIRDTYTSPNLVVSIGASFTFFVPRGCYFQVTRSSIFSLSIALKEWY